MAVELLKKEGNKVSLELEITAEKFEQGIEKAYQKLRSKINIPGFRKGKAPRKIIEVNYGKEVFYDEAVNIVFPELYEKAIESYGLKPIDYPEVDFKEEVETGKPVILKVEVLVRPEIELKQYKDLSIDVHHYELSEELVENELTQMREKNARLTDVSDRAVENGDILTIDYAGFVGEHQFEGGTAEGQTLEIGSGSFIPGFEDQLIGKHIGEEVEVHVTFPEPYHSEELAGKAAVFRVKIHEIKIKELPELDDELAKDVSEFDTLDELREDIRKHLTETLKDKEESEKESALIGKLLEINPIEVPEQMTEAQLSDELRNFEYRMVMQGFNMQDYLKLTNSSEEMLKMQMRPMAEYRVKRELLMEAVAKAENIVPTEEELQKEIDLYAENYPEEHREKIKEEVKEKEADFIYDIARNVKTMEFLKNSNVWNYVE